MSTIRDVDFFFDHRHHPAGFSAYTRLTIVHYSVDKVFDERLVEISLRRMAFTSLTLLSHHTH